MTIAVERLASAHRGLLSDRERALYQLGGALARVGYRFTTVTPATQHLLLERRAGELSCSLRDVFGWNLPFEVATLGQPLFELLQAAGACVRADTPHAWRSIIRFSTLDGLLFVHSGHPTNASDSVFFGPDSSRFVAAVQRSAPHARRIVDIGCGSGVGGIALARRFHPPARPKLVLADVSPAALSFARVNAALAGVDAEFVVSDVLDGVSGDFDLAIANPPYLLDAAGRLYRDGGGALGEALALRIVDESVARLRRTSGGGTLLLYTGSAIVDGVDSLLQATVGKLRRAGIAVHYEELDPDVFSEELERPAYAQVERIAAVFLSANVPGRSEH